MKVIGKLFGLVFRLLWLPFKLVGRFGFRALKLTTWVGLLPVKATRVATRVLGFRGIVFGALGLALGLLFAPVPGRQLREKLIALLAGGGAIPDDELADKVTFELSHAPRTWHLEPQPEVAVLAGRVVLTGEVRGDDAREEFARVAGAIPGVVAVDNQLAVSTVGAEAATE